MKILIAGGGMGGTILANNLARRLTAELRSGRVQLSMLSASERHMYQPGLLYLAFGRMTAEELYRDQASLLEPGIALPRNCGRERTLERQHGLETDHTRDLRRTGRAGQGPAFEAHVLDASSPRRGGGVDGEGEGW